ncbi:hypothetical protein, partial [Rhodococcus rhodochrous]|uniref:hypothetical protein n=1 Tax=Rhodococcus rhodochrous TaxID=1829 RepID=UPI00188C1653
KQSGGSTAFIEAPLPLSLVAGQTVILAARIRVPTGGSSNIGQVALRSSAVTSSDVWGATDQWIWRIVTARIPANASLARIRLLVDPSTGTTLTEMSVDRVCVIVGDMPADVVEQTPSTASTVRASRLLTVQPARRLFDKALLEVGTRPLIGVGLGASTWEGSSADPNRQLSVLIEKMLQASYNPPGITGGYTTKVRNSVAWAKTGSTSGIDDTDMKKIQVLNTNATATHQSWQDCTGIDIYYPSGSGIGAWTISIEGGAPVTVTPGSTDTGIDIYYPSGSGIGAWTISIEGGAPVTVTPGSTDTGIDIYYPSGSGIGAWTISIEGGAPVTVTPGSTDTGIDIYYPSGSGIGAWTISIEGGAPVTVTPGST